jgi:hypothetical protein
MKMFVMLQKIGHSTSDIIRSKKQKNCRGQKDVVIYMDELCNNRICISDRKLLMACVSLPVFLK